MQMEIPRRQMWLERQWLAALRLWRDDVAANPGCCCCCCSFLTKLHQLHPSSYKISPKRTFSATPGQEQRLASAAARSDSVLFVSSALIFVYSPASPSTVDPEPTSWWARSASKHADSFEGPLCGFPLSKLKNHKYQCNLVMSACRHAQYKNIFNSKAATTFHSIPFILFIQGQRAITAKGGMDGIQTHKQMCVLYFCSLSLVHGSRYSGAIGDCLMVNGCCRLPGCTALKCMCGHGLLKSTQHGFQACWENFLPFLLSFAKKI